MYAIGYKLLSSGEYKVGKTLYATEYIAAEHADFLEKYYARRGFTIPHDVVRVDDAAAAPAATVTGAGRGGGR